MRMQSHLSNIYLKKYLILGSPKAPLFHLTHHDIGGQQHLLTVEGDFTPAETPCH